jgi:hypothetical protein
MLVALGMLWSVGGLVAVWCLYNHLLVVAQENADKKDL